MTQPRASFRLLLPLLAAVLGFAAAHAQDSTAAAPPADQKPPPPSTNPAQRVVYAGEGQTNEQQMADQLACYNYSTEQTQWDPHEAYGVLEKEHGDALKQYQASQGGAVRAAGSFEQAAEQFKSQFQLWDRHWVACVQGKKYGVN